MRLDDLPRLTDEERAAALAAMRTAGDDFASFSRASRQEAELAAETRRVRRQTVVTNPPQRRSTWARPGAWVPGFLSRLRERRKQRRLVRAENHPGLYDDRVRYAEQQLARLQRRFASLCQG